MGRPVMLSNGSMVVGLNEHGLVHDFYYPYVGQENLTTARSVHHKIGIWVDGEFSWLDDGQWEISVNFEDEALISTISAKNHKLNLTLDFQDFIDYKFTAFCRKVNITNHAPDRRDVRLFFHQVFQISSDGRADTALFVPRGSYIFDYKGYCSLLIYCQDESSQPFDQFAVGNYAIEGKAGTYMDADDGELSGNLVEHGGVDSVIRNRLSIGGGQSQILRYWVVAADSQNTAEKMHELLLSGFEDRLTETRKYWNEWLSKAKSTVTKLDENYQAIFSKSLMVVKAHIDNHGGIIASCDSSIYNYGRDYYTYVWPRDGALTVLPLIDLGYTEEPKKFFEFCADTMHPDGYMMHKYQPDRAIGSTWHPLMHKNHPELAIQEDETAAVIFALGHYLDISEDVDFIDDLYARLIRPAGDFMAGFIDEQTSLPHASYDLWEERFGTHTYTVFLTYAALEQAVKIASRFKHTDDAERWSQASLKIKSGLALLYEPETGIYRRSLNIKPGGDLEFDNTVDSSTHYALLMFGDGLIDEKQLDANYKHLADRLADTSPSGGVIRYENDSYFLTDQKYLGNPWFICTFWLAEYKMRSGNIESGKKLIDWALERSLPSGIMSEQVAPDNSRQIGVSPLVWSHAELVSSLMNLAKRIT